MKGGLAALLLGSKGGSKGPPEGEETDLAEPTEAKPESTERKFAKLASEAIADGDHEAAADALVSLVKACTKKDYSEPTE